MKGRRRAGETPGLRSGRVVWSGREQAAWPAGLSSWETTPSDLSSMLGRAAELVVLDALSFPWEFFVGHSKDIPLVLVLPQNLDSDALSQVLGPSALQGLTPYDTLVDPREEVRDILTARWSLESVQWLRIADPHPAQVMHALAVRDAERIVVIETEFGAFAALPDDLITEHLQRHGSHQRGTLNVLMAFVGPEDVVWDVGAHIGTVSIPLSLVCNVRAVVAVEPDATSAALLRRNLALNDLEGRFTLVRAAAAARSNLPMTEHITRGNSGGNTFDVAEGLSSTTSIELDDLFEGGLTAPTLVKLDVEGAEVSALRGAERMIEAVRPILLLEVSASLLARQGHGVEELEQFLADHDYASFRITGSRNHSRTSWSVERIVNFAESTQVLFDVLAVPRGSELDIRMSGRCQEGGHE